MSMEDAILKEWERKQLDDLVEYQERKGEIEEAVKKAEAKSKANGISEEKYQIAKKMLSDKLDIKTIMKYTGLDEKTILSLKE